MFNFNLPLLNRPLLWYGFFFALGFFVGYLVLTYLLRCYFLQNTEFRQEDVCSEPDRIHEEDLKSVTYSVKMKVSKLSEQLTLYVIIGTLIGARLGDVIFYQQWQDAFQHPLNVIAIWQGGLASHGGAVGILIALWMFSKRKKCSFWTVVDFIVIPAAITAVFIRIGNFFNQEILGKVTTVPWGVVFLHPVDGGPIAPRHPAQLYEATWYLCTFMILMLYWQKHLFEPRGKLAGLFFILIFGFRFLIEFLKVEQSILLASGSILTMGQWLSLPFILLGVWLFKRDRFNRYSAQ